MSPNRANDSDLILVNGQIYTLDPACPWAEALAIRGGRIVAVGSEATVRAAMTPQTRVIDLRNKMAMPGIIDVHNHLFFAGRAGEATGPRSLRTLACAAAFGGSRRP